MTGLNLSGKRALVCGASKGIGKSVALALAGHGAIVTVLARDAAQLNKVLVELPKPEDQDHDSIVADMSDTGSLLEMITRLTSLRDYEILINNTGGPASGRLELATIPAFESAFRQHVLAAHTLMQGVVPGMKKKAYGRIVNILSTSVKQPLDNLGVSNTIRAAMANWSKTLANELASSGITVNNILPGATATDRLNEIIAKESGHQNTDPEMIAARMKSNIPMGRFAESEEIAAAVLFLASPMASYITGINLPVDGGRTRCL